MHRKTQRFMVALSGCAIVYIAVTAHALARAQQPDDKTLDPIVAHATEQLAEGQRVFRFDTFGDEAFWGGTLRLHEAVRHVSPATALAVGLKVDSEALPPNVLQAIQRGTIDVNDPAVTLALLQLNAVVGVTGFFDGSQLKSIGIQCALCHSDVDSTVAPGIGKRRDGWPNRDLNIGAIIALAPNLTPVDQLLGVDDATLRQVLNAWGPGKFDAEVFMDGKALRPDGTPGAVVIPAAFGLAGVNLHTYVGWGGVPHWNAFVANLLMHGQGTFFDPRLNDPVKFPIASKNGFGDVRADHDLITSKLPALQLYQLAIAAPRPPAGSFDPQAASRGEEVFNGRAGCTRCHVPPVFTEPGWNMHPASDIGIDDFQSGRSPDGAYRTTPLKGLFTRLKGGF